MHNNSPLDELPQNEWDAIILSMISKLFTFCDRDVQIDRDDLIQEAWVSLLMAAERYDAGLGIKFTTFACHYIYGRVRSYIQRKGKWAEYYYQDVDPFDYNVSIYDERADNRDLVDTMLETLKDQKHKELIVEHFMNHKSCRQIARESGLSHETICSRLNKLLDLLKIRLKKENAA